MYEELALAVRIIAAIAVVIIINRVIGGYIRDRLDRLPSFRARSVDEKERER